jgi:hypothetical protein
MGKCRLRPNRQNLQIKHEWIRGAGGWTRFVLQLLRLKGIPTSYKAILIALLDRIRPSGQGGAFPSHELLAEDAGCSRRTVYYALKFWKMIGVLEWKHPLGGSPGRWSNEYYLKTSPLMVPKHVSIRIEYNRAKIAPETVQLLHPKPCKNCTRSNTKEKHTKKKDGPVLSDLAIENGNSKRPGEVHPTLAAELTATGGGDVGWRFGGKGPGEDDPAKKPGRGWRDKPVGEWNTHDCLSYFWWTSKDRLGREMLPFFAKDRGQMKTLVTAVGPEKVKRMIDRLVEGWDAFRRRPEIQADMPSVGLLVGYRNLLVSEGDIGPKRAVHDGDGLLTAEEVQRMKAERKVYRG